MTKYKYNKISKMRTFEESPSKWFMVEGIKMPRKAVEEYTYRSLRHLIKTGKVYGVQRLG